MAIRRPINIFPKQRAVVQSLAAGAVLAGMVVAGSVGGAQTVASHPATPTAAQAAFFESKIRPVLLEQCVPCHGPTAQQGGVRLDTALDTWKTLTPGAPGKSTFIHAVGYAGDVQMPPTGKLPAAQIADLTQWVKDGAYWPEKAASAAPDVRRKHWAFQPVRLPIVPKTKNTVWAASPIDRFVLANLEKAHLTPAPAASKRQLIRRVYFDLVGLPPSPQAVDAFVQDKSPQAFVKVVDGLLNSPEYGERWARHWLDVARYADSNGLDENMAFGNAWRYRDWVVNALNSDKPYNVFLEEQIAGDLMDSSSGAALRNERITATGFLTLGAKVLAEQDKPKLVMDIVDEQIEVTTKATMGLTIACARCHDHKFDPISTKDYYALAGIFKSTKTMANLAFVSQVNERKISTPALETAQRARMETMRRLEADLKTAKAEGAKSVAFQIRADADKYLKAGWELAQQPGVLLSIGDALDAPNGLRRQILPAVSFVKGNAVRDTTNYGKDLGVIVTDKAPVSAEWEITVPDAGRYQVELRYAAQESRPVSLIINDKIVRKNAAPGVTGSWMPDTQRWEAQGIYLFAAGVNKLKIERNDGPIPHISRILVAPAPTAPAMAGVEGKSETAESIAKRDGLIPDVVTRWAGRLVGVRDPQTVRAKLMEDAALFAAPEKSEAFYSPATALVVKNAENAIAEAMKTAPQVPVVMAVEDAAKPENVPVHVRGSTQNLGDIVPRDFPQTLKAVCPSNEVPDEKGSGRLALAHWLTRPQHPLTARVQVNRVWQHIFGEGLVRTPDNWGLKGEKPTHPELLDYLASTFITQDKWSQKKLIRRLVLSSTYQMATVATPEITKRASLLDPENRLLWKMNRRRLEAEPLRDAILVVSGTLENRLGGTLLTSKDNDYVTNDQSGNAAQYDAPRRSLYLPVIRNAVYDYFQAFDFGDGTSVNARRASTTVAPQSLFLLNSPLVRKASDAFARSLLVPAPTSADAASDARRVQAAYRRAFGRAAAPDEVTRALGYVSRYDAALIAREPDSDKRKQRAWQSLCQALLASNEFLYVD